MSSKINLSNRIVVALAKGRLAEKTVELLEKSGIKCSSVLEPSRKLIFDIEDYKLSFMFVKPTDVPTYVEYGIADIGVCGKDTLLEEDKQVYELLDLKFGKCKLCIAGYPDTIVNNKATNLRVATKYSNTAKKIFNARNQNIEIIKLNGSIEIAPIMGLSDVIFDIVESGKTLKENDLVVLEEIYDVSARLICNKVSLKTKENILKIVNLIKENI